MPDLGGLESGERIGVGAPPAIRAFQQAAKLDSNCAMAWWGIAASAGPNINFPMDEAGAKTANDAIAQANALAAKAGPAEQAYIEALGARYSPDPKASRAALDTAYCQAMQKLAQHFPDDPDAATLY